MSGKGWFDAAYLINNRDQYTAEVLEDYEKGLELREAFLQGSLGKHIDLKTGRQIVVWGRSDILRVTDILNPVDRRTPGLMDMEDMRLPIFMTKLNRFAGPWNLGLIAVSEHRYDKNPSFGHDFYPGSQPLPPQKKPAHTAENTELAVELTGIFSGWDLSLYGARVFNDQATWRPKRPLDREHRRITMAGVAAGLARGDFLYYVEAAHLRGLGFMHDYHTDYCRTDVLGGVEYSGFRNTVVTFDIADRYLHDFDRVLKGSPENPQTNQIEAALRIDRHFMHETLTVTLLGISFGPWAEDGALERLALTYDIRDGLSITGGVALYQSGTGIMQRVDDNDRVFMDIRYDF